MVILTATIKDAFAGAGVRPPSEDAAGARRRGDGRGTGGPIGRRLRLGGRPIRKHTQEEGGGDNKGSAPPRTTKQGVHSVTSLGHFGLKGPTRVRRLVIGEASAAPVWRQVRPTSESLPEQSCGTTADTCKISAMLV